MRSGLVRSLVFWYAVIVFATFGVLNLAVSGIIGSNNDRSIEEQLRSYQQSSEVFLSRYVLKNGIWGYQEAGDSLCAVLGHNIKIYSTTGELLYNAFFSVEDPPQKDLELAMQGQSAYTVLSRGESTRVYFSFPVENFGVLRMEVDYSQMFAGSRYITRMVLYSSASVLVIALVLLVVFAGKVIEPVNRLKGAVAGLREDPISAKPLPVRRKDEIGELMREYNNMATIIREQLREITMEKTALEEAVAYRKHFYDNVTHELKTPLTIILGYAEMIEQTGFSDPEFAKKGISHIISESKRLRDMVAALLDATRLGVSDTSDFQEVDLAVLLKDVAASMELKAQRLSKSICLSLPENEQTLRVWGSQEQLIQLFINLLDNAIKYSAGKEIWAQARRLGEHVEISVENDVEQPISQEELGRLFIPFYRQREGGEPGSVGLGLAISRKIAEEHGGSIMALLSKEKRICIRVLLVSAQAGCPMQEPGQSTEPGDTG